MIKLNNNQTIGKYTVQRFIKEGLLNDSYVVTDPEGQTLFLKLYDFASVPEKMQVDGKVAEIAYGRKISHPHVLSPVDDGEIVLEGRQMQYLVTPFFRGALLSAELLTGRQYSLEEAKGIFQGVLEGLAYLGKEAGLCHNDITPRNILLEEAEDGSVVPRIIDLGHLSRSVSGAPPFTLDDLNILYMAPEALKGIFNPKGDAFSAAAVYYTLLTGKAPWETPIDGSLPFVQKKNLIRKAREAELELPEGIDEASKALLVQGLGLSDITRPDAVDLLKILTGKAPATLPEKQPEKDKGDIRKGSDTDKESIGLKVQRNTSGKGGFADVAGMDQLKDELNKRLIWVLQDKEKAAKYRLMPPNGMLLYGPPGCGKTFFAKKFAEQSGFNYLLVNGSDLGSTYVHGTQTKIAELFKKAESEAPTVICFDEFDSFVPSRGSESARHRADEVNEFLSQLNNCSERGIFVIGTTNRMDMIDPAVLRKGRLDLHYEIPAPDLDTRKAMFRIHLKDRPLAEDVDVEALARLTDNYASSDIAFIVNESAMVAALSDEPIAQHHLEESIRCNPSSLKKRDERPKIGF